MESPVISAPDLRALLGAEASARILDVRWRLDRPHGEPEFEEGHVPGAVYVDLDAQLASPGSPEKGRHPLPARAGLEAAARSWGLRAGDPVVVYDTIGGIAAARAWWLLTHAGVDGVRVLDGGLDAWVAAGGPLEAGPVRAEPGDIALTAIRGGTIDIDEAAHFAEHGTLIDARAPERYRGETEPIDAIAGHIPGAVNLPSTAFLVEGRFADASTLRAAFAAVGAEPGAPVAAYCGSGITASHTVLAGRIAGIDIALFPGSWSQWSRSDRPVAAGAGPEG